MFYTYAHTKPNGTIFYIGKGKDKRAWDKNGRSKYWTRIVNKHGFEVQILANWKSEQEAFDHEMLLISCFRDMGLELANHTNGGEGPSGMRHTDEAKLKIGIASGLRKRLAITKQRSSKSQPTCKKCIVNGMEYHSVGEAARKLKISQPTLSNWLNGKAKPRERMNVFEYRWSK